VACLALTDDVGRLRYAAAAGRRCPPGTDAPPESLVQQVVDDGEVRVLPRTTDLQVSLDGIVGAPPVRSRAGVPLGGPRRRIGALTACARQQGAFGEDEVHFLTTLANIVAAATGRHEAECQIRHRALHDALTGLPNRELLHERLDHHLRADPHSRRRTALLLIDLDGFKDVNDSQGHQAGDQVLRQVAERLRRRLRTSDTVARLGGDEFAVVLGRMDDSEQVVRIARELQALLREPFGSPGGPIALSGSIGIAVWPDHGSDTHLLLQRADPAMYRAKRERTGVEFFDPRFDETASTRLWMVEDLRAAIEGRQLELAFRPVIDLVSDNVAGVEALARWHHPRRGPQQPLQFVNTGRAVRTDRGPDGSDPARGPGACLANSRRLRAGARASARQGRQSPSWRSYGGRRERRRVPPGHRAAPKRSWRDTLWCSAVPGSRPAVPSRSPSTCPRPFCVPRTTRRT